MRFRIASTPFVARLLAASAAAVLLAGCAARPTPVCQGVYRPFDSRQECHPAP